MMKRILGLTLAAGMIVTSSNAMLQNNNEKNCCSTLKENLWLIVSEKDTTDNNALKFSLTKVAKYAGVTLSGAAAGALLVTAGFAIKAAIVEYQETKDVKAAFKALITKLPTAVCENKKLFISLMLTAIVLGGVVGSEVLVYKRDDQGLFKGYGLCDCGKTDADVQ